MIHTGILVVHDRKKHDINMGCHDFRACSLSMRHWCSVGLAVGPVFTSSKMLRSSSRLSCDFSCSFPRRSLNDRVNRLNRCGKHVMLYTLVPRVKDSNSSLSLKRNHVLPIGYA